MNSSIFGQTAKEIAKSCIPSVVSLVLEDGFRQPISIGSGFIVETGCIATNLHVIAGAKYGYVLENGSSTKHRIDGYFVTDEANDLAILSVPTIKGKSLFLSTEKNEIGDIIYAIGSPKGLSGTISEGIVSGIRNIETVNLIQITAPISPGSSGGPVINNFGHVIGVAVGTIANGQNLNFAIPSTLLKSILDRKGIEINALNVTKIEKTSISEEGDLDIKEGLSVRNIKFQTGIWSASGIDEHHKILLSFSFKNDLPYTVSDISVLIIVYDKQGIPLDYREEIYLKSSRYSDSDTGIKPFLARTVNVKDNTRYRAYRLENNYEKIEIRILDFKISDTQ
ncbi:MAG: serine protease [Flavobacteriales bacterium]|nr:serine protease [Flavobacteriales bacterium]